MEGGPYVIIAKYKEQLINNTNRFTLFQYMISVERGWKDLHKTLTVYFWSWLFR
jgi:hypothetical protein